ncbi:hypothetical protein [Mechercharimyces sp. CAU 1602]|uniref:hypothetical protein n=1 Tax=Mechercharimyces sp. CAU 1602 TaxID=2973933 RepID=UPI002161826E|nr:hypothetical protein [Mechercharimyces sp. CAU 1602]MCS1350768.1 hypothetical protein [Mechercharimyces sp. CAU 1602]
MTSIVVVDGNAFLVLDDPRGRRSIIGISLLYAGILNRRFSIPVRRVRLPDIHESSSSSSSKKVYESSSSKKISDSSSSKKVFESSSSSKKLLESSSSNGLGLRESSSSRGRLLRRLLQEVQDRDLVDVGFGE